MSHKKSFDESVPPTVAPAVCESHQTAGATLEDDNQFLLEEFDRASDLQDTEDFNPEIESNMCPTCCIPMDVQGDEYICGQCKRISPHIEGHLSSEASQQGRRNPRSYYSSSDPMKSQRSGVYESLIAHREAYLKIAAQRRGITYVPNSSLIDGADELCALAPSTSILISVAQIYNDIQRKSLAKGSPFVRRGDVKNEILAAILFVECSKSEQRSKKEIAEMMSLHTDGFSRGYEQLLRQSAEGNVSLDDDMKICENKIAFYYKKTLGAYIDASMTTLPLEAGHDGSAIVPVRELLDQMYLRFIRRVISCSIKHHIGVQSQLQSKIVGAIWFIIVAMQYPITTQQIDAMSGGIKKGTFIKFSRAIIKSARLRHIARRNFPHLSIDDALMCLSI